MLFVIKLGKLRHSFFNVRRDRMCFWDSLCNMSGYKVEERNGELVCVGLKPKNARVFLVKCPFDPSHQVRIGRLRNHIPKCPKRDPEIEARLVDCPKRCDLKLLPEDVEDHISSGECMRPDNPM